LIKETTPFLSTKYLAFGEAKSWEGNPYKNTHGVQWVENLRLAQTFCTNGHQKDYVVN